MGSGLVHFVIVNYFCLNDRAVLRKLFRFPGDCSRLYNKQIECLFPSDKLSTGYVTTVTGG